MASARPVSADAIKVAVIVGGAGGIGRASASQMAAGHQIALVDQDAGRLEAVRRGLPPSAAVKTYACDIRDDNQCAETIRRIEVDLGGIDALVLSAGLTHVSPCRATLMEVYRRVMEVNYLGSVAVTTAALPSLIERRGRIIVLSSICGFAPLMGRTGYCASKYALHGFFDTLRCELAADGVSVLIVCPSFVDTDFATRGLSGDASPMTFERSTWGRAMTPTELASRILRAAEKGRRLLVVSAGGRLAYWMSRLLPGWYDRMMTARFRVELSRDRAAESNNFSDR